MLSVIPGPVARATVCLIFGVSAIGFLIIPVICAGGLLRFRLG